MPNTRPLAVLVRGLLEKDDVSLNNWGRINEAQVLHMQYHQEQKKKKNHKDGGFPGGSVVKNPPANVGDMDSIPDPERSHVLRSS